MIAISDSPKRTCRVFLLLFISIINPLAVLSSGNISDSVKFDNYKKEFIETYWKLYPAEAILNGYYKNDSLLSVPDKKFLEFKRITLIALKSGLNTFQPDAMTATDKIDFFIMRDRIDACLWYLEELKEHEWNPAVYNLGAEFAQLINSQHKPLTSRLKTISSRLRNVESYFNAAKQQIINPVPEQTDLAILQNEGSLFVFEKLLPDSVQKSGLSEKEKNQILRRNEVAVESIKSYIEFLRNIKNTPAGQNPRSFHLGKSLYEKKFQFDLQSSYTAGEIYEIALERKKEIQDKMAVLAKSIWPLYFKTPMPDDDREVIRKVINEVSAYHTVPDSFMQAIERQIPELVRFVNDRNLIYLDPSKPLLVRKTPGYMEGSGAGVTISSPGPYDADGNTYYNVSPLDGYTPEMAESYLREYNNYTLQILNIHEAVPGHYTQLVYANQSPGMIKSIFGNGAMIEGWAVYTELMMLEEGYGNNQPELWLMYYKWHLRSVCNTILDYSVHVLNWPEKVAMRFLTEDALQERAEAENKWKRVKLTQVQLCSYFTGFTEIYHLRNEIKKQKGESFNLKEFHEKFLSFGSAPVKYIREQMLNGE